MALSLFKPSGPKKPKKDLLELPWVRDKDGKFFRLFTLNAVETGINGLPGTFLIWYSGARIGYVYIGATEDLGAALMEAKEDPAVMAFNDKGALGVTWAPLNEKYKSRVAMFLRNVLKPELAEAKYDAQLDMTAEPFMVQLPPIT